MPPAAAIVALPVLLPKQRTLVCELMVAVTAVAGSVMVAVETGTYSEDKK